MAFAQLTYRDSLRDIEACLRGSQDLLYRMGFRCKKISRNTISRSNKIRNSKIFEEFAWEVISEARKLLSKQEKSKLAISETVFALDSTIIDLCLNLFPWAKFRKTKAGIKIHTLLELETNLPYFIDISGANLHDSKILQNLKIVPGAYYVMDRAYLAFKFLYKFELVGAYFVVRLKNNIQLKRLYSRNINKSKGLISDHIVTPVMKTTAKKYPELIRRIRYRDPETKKVYEFLTNDFELPAEDVCSLYRSRWQIEIFFKWLKQNLKIKTFFGTTENAVKTQIWIAITTYALVVIAKNRFQLEQDLYIVLQVLSVMAFEKKPIKSAFLEYLENSTPIKNYNQLNLFGD